MTARKDIIGPLLVSRGISGASHLLTVLVGVPDGQDCPTLCVDPGGEAILATLVDQMADLEGVVWCFWRYRFDIGLTGGAYVLDGVRLEVAGCEDAVSIAYVSCNGKETGDFARPSDERDAMWRRLADQHSASPFGLMLSGGDQIYADAGLEAHADLSAWHEAPTREKAKFLPSAESEAALVAFFLDRWTRTLAADGAAEVYATVPGLAMWDDHDIFDGWGSRPPIVQECPMGQMIFRVARRFFNLFQAGGEECERVTLSYGRQYPGFRVVAPDLRSERQRRQVMGTQGWAIFEEEMAEAPNDYCIVMSSVPALGPRLSLLEGLHRIVPGMQKYEDDLRDQWQSRAHRDEWRRFLRVVVARQSVTVVSGEIHLATRGEIRRPDGTIVHQLTASGISHPPPPRGFARALGWLAWLGEAPIKELPIHLLPLPGTRSIYTDERNYLLLQRDMAGEWTACWELEETGTTPPLALK